MLCDAESHGALGAIVDCPRIEHTERLAESVPRRRAAVRPVVRADEPPPHRTRSQRVRLALAISTTHVTVRVAVRARRVVQVRLRGEGNETRRLAVASATLRGSLRAVFGDRLAACLVEREQRLRRDGAAIDGA